MTREQKIFIKQNRVILKELFFERMDELKDNLLNIKDDGELKIEIRFLREYRDWLQTIGILERGDEKLLAKKRSDYT